MQEIIAYILAALIGISLGLIGGGGSILTVPVLVYVLGIDVVTATGYSLFIVGTTAFVGSINYAKQNLISFKTALYFSIPSLIAVFIVRKYVVPALPENMFTILGFNVTKDIFLLLLFAILMISAAYSMILSGKKTLQPTGKINYVAIWIEGLIVGTFTGLVGAGGGFLIIPALVLFAKLPMKVAIGTSLLIIGIKSLLGFTGDLLNLPSIDWFLLLVFTAIACAGIFIGSNLAKKIEANRLKKIFGWFVLVMGIYILIKELFIN